MKNITIIFLSLFILLACKKDVNSSKESPVVVSNAAEAENVQIEQEPEINMGELMNTMGGLLTGGTSKDSAGQGMFLSNGQLNVDFLKSDAGKPMRKTFAQIAEVSLEEVDLSLTIMSDNNIVSVKHAEAIEKDLNNPKVEAYIKSGKASANFLELIKESKEKAMLRTSSFKKRAQKAKEKFYKDNPSWFALDDTSEDTFIDSRSKMVYLPLGNLSFADSVVAFQPGKPSGRNPEKGLGPAQGDASLKTDCALLGSGGILTLFFEDNAIIDVNGPDLFIFEMATIEPTNLEISKNGTDWINVGKIEGGTAFVDIKNYVKPGETFNYLRLTDLKTNFGPPPGADIDAVAAIGGALRMNLDSSVLFETGKFQLKEEGEKAIQELSLQLKNIKKGTITVEGHTDDVGSDASNKQLSLARAKSVSAAFRKAINNPTFKWKEVGYGENKPLVENNSEVNRTMNRRVEILITPF